MGQPCDQRSNKRQRIVQDIAAVFSQLFSHFSSPFCFPLFLAYHIRADISIGVFPQDNPLFLAQTADCGRLASNRFSSAVSYTSYNGPHSKIATSFFHFPTRRASQHSKKAPFRALSLQCCYFRFLISFIPASTAAYSTPATAQMIQLYRGWPLPLGPKV